MEFLTQLWMPILVAAALVWVASAIIWTAMPHRKAEWSKLSNEEAFLSFLTQGGVKPGNYMFPCECDGKQQHNPDVKEPISGPIGVLNVWPKRRSIGTCMVGSFVLDVIIGVFVAYVAWHSLQPGANYLTVFQIVGASAFMAYTFGSLGGGIWFGMSRRSMVYTAIEGFVYGGLTAGAFGWLWPQLANVADAVNALPTPG